MIFLLGYGEYLHEYIKDKSRIRYRLREFRIYIYMALYTDI